MGNKIPFGVIYKTDDKEIKKMMREVVRITDGSRISYDSVDHFIFNCGKCKEQLDVGEVELNPSMGSKGEDVCLSFRLYCKKCNLHYVRKIYLIENFHIGYNLGG